MSGALTKRSPRNGRSDLNDLLLRGPGYSFLPAYPQSATAAAIGCARRMALAHSASHACAMRVTVAMLFALAAVGACGQSNEPTTAAQTGLEDPNVRAKLRTMALQASSADGVTSPKTMTAVASPDHQLAEKIVSGDIVNDHVPVYVVVVTGGTFMDNAARTPPGVPAPSGSVLTFTVDAQTFRLTDFGLTDSAPDLTQLGPIMNLGE